MADIPPPMAFFWDGEVMRPRLPKLADKHFTVGEHYLLEVHEERSANSHRHFFAAVNEAHANLPEAMAERFATPEHLRKYALIRAGYRDERTHVCASPAEAERFARFMKPLDDFAFIFAEGATVTVWTAKSQSMRAMGKVEFQESKEQVLSFIAQLLDVSKIDLERRAAEAA